MCGRYTLSLSVDEIWDDLDLDGEPGADVWSQGPESDLIPRYNIAPTQAVPVVTDKSPKKLVMLRWGLVPFWAKDAKIGARMLNARAETVADKPAFRDAFRKRGRGRDGLRGRRLGTGGRRLGCGGRCRFIGRNGARRCRRRHDRRGRSGRGRRVRRIGGVEQGRGGHHRHSGDRDQQNQ